jgi:hypothetical protein
MAVEDLHNDGWWEYLLLAASFTSLSRDIMQMRAFAAILASVAASGLRVIMRCTRKSCGKVPGLASFFFFPRGLQRLLNYTQLPKFGIGRGNRLGDDEPGCQARATPPPSYAGCLSLSFFSVSRFYSLFGSASPQLMGEGFALALRGSQRNGKDIGFDCNNDTLIFSLSLSVSLSVVARVCLCEWGYKFVHTEFMVRYLCKPKSISLYLFILLMQVFEGIRAG